MKKSKNPEDTKESNKSKKSKKSGAIKNYLPHNFLAEKNNENKRTNRKNIISI